MIFLDLGKTFSIVSRYKRVSVDSFCCEYSSNIDWNLSASPFDSATLAAS